jgi:hypothetical protein
MNLYGFVGNKALGKVDILGMTSLALKAIPPYQFFPLEGEDCFLPSTELKDLELSGSFTKTNYTTDPSKTVPFAAWISYKFSNEFYIGPQWSYETCYRDSLAQPVSDPYGVGHLPWCDNGNCNFSSSRQQVLEVRFHFLSCECELNDNLLPSGRKKWTRIRYVDSIFIHAESSLFGNFNWEVKPSPGFFKDYTR